MNRSILDQTSNRPLSAKMTGIILSGGESNFEKITRGLGEVFFEKADEYCNDFLQIDALTGMKETFASAKLRSIRLAISLQKLGITSEDIVVTCLKITIDTAIPHLAVLYLGAKFAAIDPIQTEKDWRHCLGLVKPRLIFVDEDQVDKLKKCLGSSELKTELIVHGESNIHRTFEDLILPHPGEELYRPKVIQNSKDTALILFSSGTTGLPKAMTLSHYSMLNSTKLFLDMYDSKYFSTELVFSTYYWISSMRTLTRCFVIGSCRLLFSKFQPEETLRAIEKYKVSFCFISPATSQQLLKVANAQDYDLSSVKLYLSGGTRISPEHIVQLRNMFQDGIVLNVYGSTEAGGCVTGYDLEHDMSYTRSNLSTTGKCVKDMKIKIKDEASREILGPNRSGEIWVKSLYGMNGYYNNSTPLKLDPDGFFQTGDIGYYDENYFMHINGRSNDMFKYGTLKVIPEYWESVLQSHSSIYEAGVFGILHGSEGWLPAACIVLEEHASMTAEEIQSFFIENMTERYKLVGGIRFVQELPKTPSSKLRRKELFDVFMKGTLISSDDY